LNETQTLDLKKKNDGKRLKAKRQKQENKKIEIALTEGKKLIFKTKKRRQLQMRRKLMTNIKVAKLMFFTCKS